MTYCLKGHRRGGRRRGNESLLSPHLRFTIPDLRSPTPYRVNRILSIENSWHPCSLRLGGMSGQIKVIWPKSNQKSGSATCQWRLPHASGLAPYAFRTSLLSSAANCQPLPAFPRQKLSGLFPSKTFNLLGKSAKNTLKNTRFMNENSPNYFPSPVASAFGSQLHLPSTFIALNCAFIFLCTGTSF